MFLKALEEDKMFRDIKAKENRAQRLALSGNAKPTTKVQIENNIPDLEQGVAIKVRALKSEIRFGNKATRLAVHRFMISLFSPRGNQP